MDIKSYQCIGAISVMSGLPVILFAIGSVLGLIVLFLYLKSKKKAKEDADAFIPSRRRSELNFYGKFARFLGHQSLTRPKYQKIHEQVSSLYPADNYTIENKTGKILLISYFWGGVCFLFAFIMLFVVGFDLFYALAGLFAGLVMSNVSSTNKLQAIRRELLAGEQATFTSIRHIYHQDRRVDSAVNKAISTATPIMAPHLSDIYDILSSPDMVAKSEEYTSKHTDKYLSMFLAICTAVKEYGDTKTKTGQSLFLSSLGYLKEEVDAELIAQQKKDNGFKGVVITTFIPLLCVKLFQKWAVSNMPEIAQYYTGLYSTVAVMVMFVGTYIIYTMIDSMITGISNETKQTSVFQKISAIEPLSSALSHIVAQRYNRYIRIDSELRATGDHTGVKAYLTKSFTYALIGFLMVVGVIIGGTYIGKDAILSNFNDDFVDVSALPDEYKETMYKACEDMARNHLRDDITKEELETQIREKYSVGSLQASLVAEAVITHIEEYHDRYFRWWSLVIALLAGVAAFFIPSALLLWEKKSIDFRRQAEIMQFQTLMLILMHIPGMSVAKILDWLERFSSIFVENIVTARSNLGAGQEIALQEMKDSESFEPFRSFCDNLLAVDKSGVEDAFSEVEAEHDYYMETKKIAIDSDITKKVAFSKTLSMMPLWMVVGFYLLIPMVRYALSMFSVFTSAMGGM